MINGASGWSIRSVLISVTDLDRSTGFYQDVMRVQEVLRDDQMAVLSSDPTGSVTLFLRQAHHHAIRSGQQALGARAVSCDVGTFAELDRVEDRLRALDAFRDRRFLDEAKQFEVLRGHDPDRLALMFVAYEAGKRVSLQDYCRALTLMYGMDA